MYRAQTSGPANRLGKAHTWRRPIIYILNCPSYWKSALSSVHPFSSGLHQGRVYAVSTFPRRKPLHMTHVTGQEAPDLPFWRGINSVCPQPATHPKWASNESIVWMEQFYSKSDYEGWPSIPWKESAKNCTVNPRILHETIGDLGGSARWYATSVLIRIHFTYLGSETGHLTDWMASWLTISSNHSVYLAVARKPKDWIDLNRLDIYDLQRKPGSRWLRT